MTMNLQGPITPRGIEINVEAARPLDAIRVARDLLHTVAIGAIGTLDPESGYPYATTTNIALRPDGTVLFFAAGLALHARNIEADPRISITLLQPGARDAMLSPRLTLVGRAIRLEGAERDEACRRYALRHPKAKLYLALPDAWLYRLEVEGVQLNGGPAQNANDVTPASLLTDLAGADALMKREGELVAALNDGAAGAARLAAVAGPREGRWRVTGVDPEGIDLAGPGGSVRHWFGARVTDAEMFELPTRETSAA